MLRRTVVASAFACLAWVPLSMADTLPTMADTQINLTAVAAKGGALPALMVKNTSPGPSYRTFAKFDLTALAPGLPVQKATLRVWANLVTTEGDVDIAAVLGAWDEASLTAVIAPSLSTAVGGFSVTKAQQKTYVNADVTQLVRDWVRGTLVNNGLALLGDSGLVNVRFDSKESMQTSHPMELEVILGLPEGTGDITGVYGMGGLTGGGNVGSVYLDINPAVTQRRVWSVCSPGSSIRAISDSGTVACEPDDVGSIVQMYPLTGFASSIPGGSTTYAFIGPTASFTLAAGQHVTGSAATSLGLASGTSFLPLGLCYQPLAGGTISSFTGGFVPYQAFSTVRANYSAAGTIVLSAGSWRVGMCVLNNSTVAISNTTYVNGWFMVSN